MKLGRSVLITGLVTVLLAVLTGCGSSSSGSSSRSKSVATPATSSPASTRTGSFTVAYSDPIAANVTLQGIANGLSAQVKREGGSLKIFDAGGSPAKQEADLKTMIAAHVNAIVVYPLDWTSVRGILNQAAAAGIKVFAIDAVLDTSNLAGLSPVRFEIIEGRQQQAAQAANFIAQRKPGAQIVGITFCPNPPTHVYLFDQFKADVARHPGMKLLTVICNPSDDEAGAFPVARDALTRYSGASAVYAYNDPSAIGASRAAQAEGMRGKMVITGYNASPDGVQAVKAGTIDATWDYKPVEMGQTLGRAIQLVLSHKDARLPRAMVMQPVMYTKANIGQFIPWSTRVSQIQGGKYLGLRLPTG